MIRVLIALITAMIQRPDLFAEHSRAYAALFQQEGVELGRVFMLRLMSYIALVLSTLVCVCLSGVALMLGLLFQQFHWVLVVVPGVAAVLFCLCLYSVSRPFRCIGFCETRLQLGEDIKALCLTTKP